MNIMAVRHGRLLRGTPAELAAEEAVARLGVPYRFQFPGYLYGQRAFPDFYLPTIGVVLEVDDPSHNRLEKREADAERTETLEAAWGCRVARITNREALTNPDEAIRSALAAVGKWPLPARRPPMERALPQPKKAPQAKTREAKSQARRVQRMKGNRSGTDYCDC